MKFRYEAMDRGGASAAGVIEASTDVEAQEMLRRKGLFVSVVEASRGRAEVGGGASAGPKALSHFLRQLSVLVSTGTPVVEAIASLERQAADGSFKDVLKDVRRRLEDGASLSESMAAHPRVFDSVCRSLISAGEAGGKLDEMLVRLASLVRQQAKIRANVTGAMVYPSLLVVVSISVMITMLCFVLPRFEGLFKSLDTPLPTSTQWLMSLSDLLRGQWYWIVAVAAALGGGLWAWLRTPGGHRAVHTVVLHAPPVGTIIRGLCVARVARMLGVLLQGRVVMLEALRLTRDASGNMHYAELMARAEERVSRGELLSTVFEKSPLIPGTVVEAVRSGERSGQLGQVMTSLADFLDEDNEVVVRTLTSILEPAILIVLGMIVAFMAMSMFLPLFDLTSAAGGGGH